jgi:protein-S-isoprenylcysteine O-methyltransferase Ste14
MANDERDNAGVVAPPPLIYAGPLAVGLLLNKKFPVPFLPRGMARIIGWPLFLGGFSLGGWFVRTMRQADTPLNPEKPVSNLALGGPFSYTRNPGYLSMAMVYAGVASLKNALWAILLLPAALHVIQHGVIFREERYLERKFGKEYLDYKARVRQWI